MKNEKSKVFKYFIEFLIVAFGVFLGVYASELQNEKKIKREKEKSISYILEELASNKERLLNSVEYHQLLKTQIDSIVRTLKEADFFTTYIGNKHFRHDRIKGWKGIQIAKLESTAFEAAKITGIIREFDIEFIQKVSKAYKYQETYSKFGNSILTKMVNLNSSSKVLDVFGAVELMTTDLLSNEKELLNIINEIN